MEKVQKDLTRAIRKGDVGTIIKLRREHDHLPSLEGETYKKTSISGVDLSYLDFTNTEWDSCMLERVQFKAVEWEGAYFPSSIFVDAQFEKSRLFQVAADGSVFRNCRFIDIDFEEVELSGADFVNCEFTRCQFDQCEIDASTFTGGTMTDVSFDGGTFNAVTFRDVEQKNVRLIDVELSGCSGSGTLPEGFRPLTGRRKVVQK